MAKIKPKYPVREYLGKFEAWLLVIKGGMAMRTYDATLERLFAMFPKRTSVDQFVSMDIGDYVAIRLKQNAAELTLFHELNMLSNFFKWCIEDQGLKIYNPALIYKRQWKDKRVPHHKVFTLDKLTRLLDAVPLKEKRIILNVVQGGKCPGVRAEHIIRKVAQELGLENFSLSQVKRAVRNRLGRDIVEYYCREMSKSLPTESESNSNAFGAVQISSLNVGATICNSDGNTSVSEGINQQ